MWLDWLDEAARLTGYPVVKVEGWERRGHGQMAKCEGVVGHHTGTGARSAGDYPTLRVVRDGRTGLKGPLSHLGLGRNGTVYVIAAGACYHAGNSMWAGFGALNDKFIGIEAESPGDGSWTAEQRDAYPKLVGALLHRMDRGRGRYVSHRTCALPAGRKPDPAGLSDEWMREHAQLFMDELARPAPPIGPTPGTAGPAALPTLRKGDRNDDVLTLHHFLVSHYPSYAKFSPTGFYGDATVATVKEFQRRVGITGPDADGTIVGPKTNAKLWAEGYRGRS